MKPLQSYAVAKRTLALSITTLALSSGTHALAQSESGVELEEIIVTAERRSNDIQKTPLAITALSDSAISNQGIVNPAGLQDLVPSLNIVSRGGTGTNIAVRGLVTNTTAPQGGPSVAVNVDDIFVARTQATNANFFDISRVEVLRGPQGTLYGKNATAGAINIISNNPEWKYGGNIAIDVGNYNTLNTNGMINVPVTDTLALRGAFQTVKHDGYIGQLEDADSYAGRLKLLYKPSEDISLLVSGHYNHIGGHGSTDVGYSLTPGASNPSDPWTQNLYPADIGHVDSTMWGINTHFTWDLHALTLTYISGYEVLDVDHSTIVQLQGIADTTQKSHAVSNELRLTSDTQATTAGTFGWVAGLYFFNESQYYAPSITSGALHVTEVEPAIPNNSQAAFAQGTYALTNSWRLTAGIRYTRDYLRQSGTFTEQIGPNVTSFPISGEIDFSNTSWKLGIEKDFAERVMGYFSVTTGYHAGGLTDSIPETAPQGNAYKPEHVTDYEAGLKGRWFDNRVQLNGDVFYYDYRDLQVGVTAPPFFPTTYNAHKAHLMGVELEGAWLLTAADQVNFSVIYEDSEYTDYCVPNALFTGTGPITTCSNGQTGYDYSGRSFNFVPKWAGNLGYQHSFAFANGAKLTPALSSRFKTHYGNQSEQFSSFTNSNFTLTYAAANDRWNVMGYVRNIENKPDYTSAGTLMNPTLDLRTLVAPRTFGVRAQFNW